MRALIIDPTVKASIAKVVAYAMEPDHWYHYGSSFIPGNHPAYTVDVPQGFRCVFSYTEKDAVVFRHLSVSVNGPLFPSPEACIMLAKEFGFTSSTDDFNLAARMERDGWLVDQGHKGEHCIVLVQPIDHLPERGEQ